MLGPWAVPPISTASSSDSHAHSTAPPHDILFLRSRVKYLEEQFEKASRSPATASTFPSMQLRIRQLEEQLSKTSPSSASTCPSPAHTSAADIETRTSRIGGTFHIHHPSPRVADAGAGLGAVRKAQAISRGLSHKTRLLGQSHWAEYYTVPALLTGLARKLVEIMEFIEPHFAQESSQALADMTKCKHLARSIKSQRAPPWPAPPTPQLPPRHIADELIDRYLQTVETVYRILHVPSFKRDYDAIWAAPDGAQPSTGFLVQLKLVLALGAVTYDDTCSLRPSATKWIYEAQTYLSEPVYKSRLGIQTLQTRVLMLLAQELIDVSGDSVWIAVGSVMRMAVAMGLHRDPSYLPDMSLFQAEMRRRLWNTILELAVQTSLQIGGPPLLTTRDFDAEAPGNFDDETLLVEEAAPRPDAELTDTTVARALRKTFPVRLKLAQTLNDLNTVMDKYEDTVRLDAEMRREFKEMRQRLQRCRSLSSSPRYSFAVQTTDFIMHRAISSLHAPYFAASLHETAYAFSRKVLMETSLKIWCAVWPSSAVMGGTHAPSPNDDLFSRFIACGGGFFHTAAFRAAFILSEELRGQLKEDEGLLGIGRMPLRTDLLAVVKEAVAWNLRCVEAGETSVKGHLVASLLCANINGVRQGLGKEELDRCLSMAAEKAVKKGLAVLEDIARKTGAEVMEVADASRQMEMPSTLMDGWDLMMPDAMLVPDYQGTLGWTFGDGAMPGLSIW